jgi:hypothetical protein
VLGFELTELQWTSVVVGCVDVVQGVRQVVAPQPTDLSNRVDSDRVGSDLAALFLDGRGPCWLAQSEMCARSLVSASYIDDSDEPVACSV